MSPCPMRLWCLLPVEGADRDRKHEIFFLVVHSDRNRSCAEFPSRLLSFFSVLVKKKSTAFIGMKNIGMTFWFYRDVFPDLLG